MTWDGKERRAEPRDTAQRERQLLTLDFGGKERKRRVLAEMLRLAAKAPDTEAGASVIAAASQTVPALQGKVEDAKSVVKASDV